MLKASEFIHRHIPNQFKTFFETVFCQLLGLWLGLRSARCDLTEAKLWFFWG